LIEPDPELTLIARGHIRFNSSTRISRHGASEPSDSLALRILPAGHLEQLTTELIQPGSGMVRHDNEFVG
jgi:hypothetical protein